MVAEPAIISALATIIAGLLTSSGLALASDQVASISTAAATVVASLLVALVTRYNVFSKLSVERMSRPAPAAGLESPRQQYVEPGTHRDERGRYTR